MKFDVGHRVQIVSGEHHSNEPMENVGKLAAPYIQNKMPYWAVELAFERNGFADEMVGVAESDLQHID